MVAFFFVTLSYFGIDYRFGQITEAENRTHLDAGVKIYLKQYQAFLNRALQHDNIIRASMLATSSADSKIIVKT